MSQLVIPGSFGGGKRFLPADINSKQITSHLVVTEVNDDLIWNNLLMGRVKYNTNDIRIEYETKLQKKRL